MENLRVGKTDCPRAPVELQDFELPPLICQSNRRDMGSLPILDPLAPPWFSLAVAFWSFCELLRLCADHHIRVIVLDHLSANPKNMLEYNTVPKYLKNWEDAFGIFLHLLNQIDIHLTRLILVHLTSNKHITDGFSGYATPDVSICEAQ